MPKHKNWRDAHNEFHSDIMERFDEGEVVEHSEYGQGQVVGHSNHPEFDDQGNCISNQRSIVVEFKHGREFIRENCLDELRVLN